MPDILLPDLTLSLSVDLPGPGVVVNLAPIAIPPISAAAPDAGAAVVPPVQVPPVVVPVIAIQSPIPATTQDGTEAADTMVGTEGNDVIAGHGGDDVIHGGAGHDWLIGGAGDDTLWGGAGDDIILGGAGNDLLLGGEGDDTLHGNEGDDTLVGGAGHDVFAGDVAGADTFRFDLITDSLPDRPDEIFGFESGVDRIDIAGIDAVASTPDVLEPFTFIGTQAFTAAGQVRIEPSADGLLVMLETTGDGIADFVVLLRGATTLAASDFDL